MDLSTARISVIVPTYNRAAFLPATISSIFGQTLPVHEVVVVDDGSTDDTVAVVEGLASTDARLEGRLRLLRQDNLGKSVALNRGLEAIEGEWIAFNDSDDRWLPEKLELQFAALAQFPEAGASFTDSRFVNDPKFRRTAFQESRLHYESTFGLQRDVPSLHSAASGIYMQTMVVRADLMRRLGGFDQSIRMSMDTDLVFRLGLITPMCYVNRPLVEVDRTVGRTVGLTTEHPMGSIERLEVHEYLHAKWLGLIDGTRSKLRASLLDRRSSTQSELANRHLLLDDVAAAKRVMTRAVRQNFQIGLFVKFLWASVAPPC